MQVKNGGYMVFLILAGGLVFPEAAFAIQFHGAPEGLYLHQIGHVLFAAAMVGFAYRIRNSRLRHDTAWQLMTWGACLLVLWNGWAFTGHILSLDLVWQHLNGSGNARLDLLRYYSQMDHLLCVPALLCIYLALRKMVAAKYQHRAGKEEQP